MAPRPLSVVKSAQGLYYCERPAGSCIFSYLGRGELGEPGTDWFFTVV